jgi:hypothetical protein
MNANLINFNLLESMLSLQGVGVLLRLFISFILFIYLVFSFLVVKQVKLLNKSFQTEGAFLFMAFAYGHFIATLLLLLFTASTIL